MPTNRKEARASLCLFCEKRGPGCPLPQLGTSACKAYAPPTLRTDGTLSASLCPSCTKVTPCSYKGQAPVECTAYEKDEAYAVLAAKKKGKPRIQRYSCGKKGQVAVGGTCCDCGYRAARETPCTKRADGTHCEHWWDGPEVGAGNPSSVKPTKPVVPAPPTICTLCMSAKHCGAKKEGRVRCEVFAPGRRVLRNGMMPGNSKCGSCVRVKYCAVVAANVEACPAYKESVFHKAGQLCQCRACVNRRLRISREPCVRSTRGWSVADEVGVGKESLCKTCATRPCDDRLRELHIESCSKYSPGTAAAVWLGLQDGLRAVVRQANAFTRRMDLLASDSGRMTDQLHELGDAVERLSDRVAALEVMARRTHDGL